MAMSYISPKLDGAIRKRPVIETPLIPPIAQDSASISHPQYCNREQYLLPPNTTSNVFHPSMKMSPADSNFKPNPDVNQITHGFNQQNNFKLSSDDLYEINQLFQTINSVRNRYIHLLHRHYCDKQDNLSLQEQLTEAQSEADCKSKTFQRAHASICELQDYGSELIKRLQKVSKIIESVNGKESTLKDLISSMETIKDDLSKKASCLESKVTNLTHELEQSGKQLQELDEKNRQQEIEFHLQISLLTESKKKCEEENDLFRKEIESLEHRIAEEQRIASQMINELQMKNNDAESKSSEFRLKIRDLIKQASQRLGCNVPFSFGDGGIEAMSVVLDELIIEKLHADKNLHNEWKSKIKKFEEEKMSLQNEINVMSMHLATRDDSDSKKKLELIELQKDMENQISIIRKLEERIAIMHLEATQANLKMAEMQFLRVLKDVFVDVVLEGQIPEPSADYEDIKSVTLEKISHWKCEEKFQVLQETLTKKSQDLEKLQTQNDLLKADYNAKEKILQDKLTFTMSNFDKSEKTNGKRNVSDKAVESLISLIEKETQELKELQHKSTPSKKSKSISSTSSTGKRSRKYRKRSPLPSNASEVDLWSVFAKRV